MNNEEAIKVLRICLAADGGCSFCSKVLVNMFIKKFPEHISLGEAALRHIESNHFREGEWNGT